MQMNMDVQLFYFLHQFAGQSRVTDGIIVFFASYLAYILIALFLGFVFFSSRARWEKIELLGIAGASTVIARFGATEIIRFFYHRPRPFLSLPIHPLFTDTSWSFPSGHATFFFALSTVVYLYNKKWGIWFFVATICITVGRVIAGVHYPSDILAGALIGGLFAYIIHFFVQKALAD